MSPCLVVEPDGGRKTIRAGAYGVRVRMGSGCEAPISLVRYGMSGPTVRFRLNQDLLMVLYAHIKLLLEPEAPAAGIEIEKCPEGNNDHASV